MLKYFEVGSIKVPTYGMAVLLGIVVVNVIAGIVIKKNKLDFHRYVLIELSGGIGAIVGAKLLALLEAYIRLIIDESVVQLLEQVGYSYYGGLFGFLIATYVYSSFGKMDIREYACKLTFLFPLLHAFWKIGCYLGGCCIGQPYIGRWAITYPMDVNVLSGTSCFPIQLVESMVAIMICMILIIINWKNIKQNQMAVYLQLYGITRFVIEFFRYHGGDGIWSISHIMSCICICVGLYMGKNNRTEVYNE